MPTIVWVIVGTISVVFWSWLLYEAWNAPVMSDDYNLTEEEKQIIKKLDNKIKKIKKWKNS